MVVIAGPRRKGKPLAGDEAHAQASALVEEQYQNFDVVWAKLAAFPWWPGVLFYSWDAVNEAGLDLKQTQQQLPIPPPTMLVLPDGTKKPVFSVLIIFLDRFNCGVIEVTPKTVCPFAINYDRLKNSQKGKAGFKLALERATRLLHMQDHMTVEELDAFAPIRIEPTEEELVEQKQQVAVPISHTKRQKRSHAAAKEDQDVEDFEDDEEDQESEASLESDYTDGEREVSTKRSAKSAKKSGKKTANHGTVPKAAPKKMPAKVPQRVLDLSGSSSKSKQAKGKHSGKHKSVQYVEAIDEDDDDSDFELVTSSHKAAAKPTSTRKKASRKEGRADHDVINVDDDDDDDYHGDFQMSIAPPPSKNARPVSAKIKSSKNAKAKPEYGTIEPIKLKKKKSKSAQPEYEVEILPAASAPKKKGPKRNSHIHHHDSHSHSEKKVPRSAALTPAQPLTLTPLSTIWTTRESSSTVVDDKAHTENFARLAYKLDLLWDETVFTDDIPPVKSSAEVIDAGEVATAVASGNNERGAGKRQVRSVQQSQIRQSMLTGNLDPHTMVQCEAYLPKGGNVAAEAGSARPRGVGPQLEAPFEVVVHPDVVFVCDLHSHLATCEIIGFLGGRWDDATKTLFIQAAFPCRSLEIEGDDGSTDVEMDPGSEIELREIIQNAELEVVGWYHSHPAFAPDPSIRDIENQTSYQQLFQRSKVLDSGKTDISYPFVGLIVGTYDQRRDSPVGLFRYFHTREERLNSGMRGAVHMPYELVPRKRHFRSVLDDVKREETRRLPLYESVVETLFGADKVRFVKTPTPPTDPKVSRSRDDKADTVSIETGDTAGGGRKKKRKGSTDLMQAGKDELVQHPAKKKRGRAKSAAGNLTARSHVGQPQNSGIVVSEVGDIGAPPEVIDLLTDASQEQTQSQDQEFPTEGNGCVPSKDGSVAEQNSVSDTSGTDSGRTLLVQGRDGQLQDNQDESPSTKFVPRVITPAQVDVVMVDESNESQSEATESASHDRGGVGHHDGKENGTAAEDAPAISSIVMESGFSEEMICDSSQSQEMKSVEDHNDEDENNLGQETRRTSMITQPEDVVSASTTSSSRSESSFSYDASQSQNMSQSQLSSQPEDSVESTPPATCPLDDDVYAGVEVIKLTEPSSVVSSEESSTKDPAKSATTADGNLHISEMKTSPAMSDVGAQATHVSVDEGIADAHGHQLDEAKSAVFSMQDVVGDSGPDIAGPSATESDECKVPVAYHLIQRSPAEGVESGLTNSVPVVESAPIDASSLATGRRRTRKPSLTVRRQSGATTSPGRTNASPRSPDANSTSGGDDGGDAKADDNQFKYEAEPGRSVKSNTDLATEDRQSAADHGWDDVEIIGQDSFDGTPTPTPKPEPTTFKVLDDATAAEKTESGASSQVLKSEENTVISRVEDQPVMVVEVTTDHSGVEVQVKHEANARENSAPEAPPNVEPTPVHTISTGVSRLAAVAGVRKTKSNSQIPVAGFLVEPLEKYPANYLRMAVVEMGISKSMNAPDRRKKQGCIDAIRAHWIEMRQRQPSSNADADGRPVADASHPHSASGVNGVIILDEVKEVVRALVANVESVVLGDMEAVAAHSQNLPAKPFDSVQAHIAKAEETITSVAMVPGTSKSGQAMASEVVAPCEVAPATATLSPQPTAAKATPLTLQDRRAVYLQALRTKYGSGAYGCSEQVITLIDYYRDFHRRTNIYDVWKPKVLKLEKIEASLRADVESVNLPVVLRDAFIKDIIGYLRTSWKLSSSAMK